MGKANRERRRLKEKDRRRARAASSSAEQRHSARPPDDGLLGSLLAPPAPPSLEDTVAIALSGTLRALDAGDDQAVSRLIDLLADDPRPAWRRAVLRSLQEMLRGTIEHLWQHGWQPVDLLRVLDRRLRAGHVRLFKAAVAEQMTRYAAATVDRRWTDQLAEAEVTVWWPRELTAVQACSQTGDWTEAVTVALELVHELSGLHRIETLMPLPGTAVPSRTKAPDVDERVLSRVRALLAKAESTTFEAEAETFTAGAQALMARHSIDHALLAAAGRAPGDAPTGRRLGIDNPYEGPKAALLDSVAVANRCRVVWTKHYGFATVIGFPTDLDQVELLFTSLLVQATVAMNREGSRRHRGGGSRTRSFRQSFLLAYAQRIRERLTETTEAETATAAAEPGKQNLLPVLASRNAAVEEATATFFPTLTSRPVASVNDREGWASGRAAADRASLNPATQIDG